MANHSYNWDASEFFRDLTENNRLAKERGFKFCRVSGLEGFEDALSKMQNAKAFVCVNEVSNGYTQIDNAPRTRRTKTIFFAMRHKIDDMAARQERFDTMRELFRQFMTRLILEKTKLEQHMVEIDRKINFNEIDEYFFSGCACAYFTVAIDVFTDLRFDNNDWL